MNSYISNVTLLLNDEIDNHIEELANEVHLCFLDFGKEFINHISEIGKLNAKSKAPSVVYDSYYNDRKLLDDEYKKSIMAFIEEIRPKLDSLTQEVKKYLKSRTKTNYTV